MKHKRFTGVKGYTMEDTRYVYQVKEKTPKDAPNVVYIVMDDMGFAHLGCYGSNIHTPNLDHLAEEGLRYNNFHTTAICSATRASLLTGMNHHTAGICGVVEWMTGCDNGVGHVKADCATLAEILKEYDYGTYAVGKWHLADVSETTEAGPFDHWPLGKGFDRYCGFLHAQMSQFHPRLVRDNGHVEVPKTVEEGYHFSEDITDQAIRYIFHQKVVYPEKPFFLYMAFGAMHTPHHAPKEYIDRYKGKFDAGWDVMRVQWFERQKELGIIPQDTELPERNELVPAWEELTDKQKKIAARYMEAYAGMLEHTDAQIGRLLDYLRETGELDRTVVVFLSDNGTCSGGAKYGRLNCFKKPEESSPEQAEQEADYVLAHLDEIGSATSFCHYPQGWAQAGNTPFRWYKTWTYSGGIKDPLIIRYPKLIADPGAVRNQYHHVSDITPTVLDILGVEKPSYIKGVFQKAFQGTSLKYTLEDGTAADRKHVQYYEICGNRSIYQDGWTAIVNHFKNASGGRYEDDKWELYHTAEDYTELHNVAEQYPEKVKELERTWMIQAAEAGVFPMLNGALYGSRTQSIRMYDSLEIRERFDRYEHIVEPFDIIRSLYSNMNKRSHVVRATIRRDSTQQQGVIFAAGNYHGGYVLYIVNNRPTFCYNYGSRFYHRIESDPLPAGTLQVEYRFKVKQDGSALVSLYVEREKRKELIVPRLNSAADFVSTVGANKDSAVAPMDYAVPFAFEGVLDAADIIVEGYRTTLEKELEAFFDAD